MRISVLNTRKKDKDWCNVVYLYFGALQGQD